MNRVLGHSCLGVALLVALTMSTPSTVNSSDRGTTGGDFGNCNFNGKFASNKCAGGERCTANYTTAITPPSGVKMKKLFDNEQQCTQEDCRPLTANFLRDGVDCKVTQVP